MKKHILNAFIGLGFASVFMFLTLRNKPVDEIFSLLREAQIGWILISMVFLGLIFLTRSLRWQLFLSNSGEDAALKDVAYSLLLGTFVNAFTPKLGEVIRCTSLEKNTGIKTSKALGTTISDRVWDIMVLVSGVLIVLIVESDRLGALVAEGIGRTVRSIGSSIGRLSIIISLALAVIILTWALARRFGLADRIRLFTSGVASAARKTFRIKKAGIFAFYTAAIWLLMILMNFACLKALPSTDNLSFYFAVVVLFIGTLGWAIPSPAGIGTSHFFVLQLFLLFGLKEESGVAYGLLVNGVQLVITLVSGSFMVAVVYIYRISRQWNNTLIEQ